MFVFMFMHLAYAFIQNNYTGKGKGVLIEYLNQCRGEQRHPVYRNVFTSSASIHYLESIWLDLMCRVTIQVLGIRPLTLMGEFDG